MKRTLIALAILPVLGACSIMQDAYDDRLQDECRDLPNTQERLDCERAAQDAEIRRRAEQRD